MPGSGHENPIGVGISMTSLSKRWAESRAAWLGLIAAVVVLIAAVVDLVPWPWTSASVRFEITAPRDLETVDVAELVRFTTPHLENAHYIVVTPLVSPSEFWVGPVRVSESGSGAAEVRFGSKAVGAGERFTVKVVATPDESLAHGTHKEVPPDSFVSKSIVVVRSE